MVMISIKQAARILKVHPQTVYIASVKGTIRRERGPGRRPGQWKWLVSAQDVIRLSWPGTAEIADRVGYCQQTIWWHVTHGNIPEAVRVGKDYRVPPSAVERWKKIQYGIIKR